MITEGSDGRDAWRGSSVRVRIVKRVVVDACRIVEAGMGRMCAEVVGVSGVGVAQCALCERARQRAV